MRLIMQVRRNRSAVNRGGGEMLTAMLFLAWLVLAVLLAAGELGLEIERGAPFRQWSAWQRSRLLTWWTDRHVKRIAAGKGGLFGDRIARLLSSD